ncbi:Autophagy protein 7 [Quaeritorhiza haematococci]|nr:Autophagy protein 7 [Quaeritorhiza haematococci]
MVRSPSILAPQIWSDIKSGAAIDSPELLTQFLLITFADLKKYKFYYWFAFPALMFDEPARVRSVKNVSEVFNADQAESFRTSYEALRNINEVGEESSDKQTTQSTGKGRSDGGAFFLIRKAKEGNGIHVGKLNEWETFFAGCPEDEIMVGFADPSALPQYPGWPLRNFLMLIKKRWNLNALKILCYREQKAVGGRDMSNSVVLDVELPGGPISDEMPKAVGWEKNSAGKLGARIADLSPLMDPKSLANTAVDLNLKLMRWRIMPNLKLEKIASTKCLLLGAGTLGSYVARSLLAWGVRHITFVDNAKVSFSNPVRQPLYFFEDCLAGGKPKAEAAAESLKRIFPSVVSEGHGFTIPMPGHPVSSESQAKASVDKLTELIKTHDAIFLLTDSRESRWLPTMLGAHFGKIVINAALGFDTFLVMRHGMRTSPPSTSSSPPSSESATTTPVKLGCYFCNDVVAPTDSLSDRTLDQQCTVTRPGLSALASALAVELLATLINHPDGPWAPANTAVAPTESLSNESITRSPLGLVPHQVRGFLSHFSNLLIVGQAYDRCTACSPAVLDKYSESGFEFLLQAFNSPSYLEEVAGLTELMEGTDDAALDWDEEEDEDL